MNARSLHALLNDGFQRYHCLDFIDTDPIQIPHRFSQKPDIEIAGFLSCTLAWGQRKAIIKTMDQWMQLMDNAPFEFIVNHTPTDLKRFDSFVYRTFQSMDARYFMTALQQIYQQHGGLESAFAFNPWETNSLLAIERFRTLFGQFNMPQRTQKHLASPMMGSAAKRINLFLRWMVRPNSEVDFGIWKNISPSQLSCPLDVHSGTTARSLGLIHRKNNDWKAVEELDNALRKLDPLDPVKYDYALFGYQALIHF